MSENIIYKKCIKCSQIKNISEFSNHKLKPDGKQSNCKECCKSMNKSYYKKNQSILMEKHRKYSKDNREKYRESEKLRLSIYFLSPIGKTARTISKHKRRSKTKQGDVTLKQLLELQQNVKDCYWCNTPLENKKVHIDHYIPISKGGEHTISNLVISCSECNMRKNAKDPIVFANSIGKLL